MLYSILDENRPGPGLVIWDKLYRCLLSAALVSFRRRAIGGSGHSCA